MAQQEKQLRIAERVPGLCGRDEQRAHAAHILDAVGGVRVHRASMAPAARPLNPAVHARIMLRPLAFGKVRPSFQRLARMHRFSRLLILAAGLAGLGGCATLGDGYYGGVDYGPGVYGAGYVGAGYGTGWYDGWYYPGGGYYVYDRYGHRRGWNAHEQQYWRERRLDRREYRADRSQDRQAYRVERRADRQAFRSGQVERPAFRADRQQDRRAYRVEQLRDRAQYRADRRQDRRDFRRGNPIRRN
jgi:hypothetical protein